MEALSAFLGSGSLFPFFIMISGNMCRALTQHAFGVFDPELPFLLL
ncbi:hypothetical protein SmJEL517_g01506 [Synchytrium microbalum]|uniref:Uncharacterized protein n=1 Tax=Synchytrium microbalum TaxID=1806994 RepID=A0A507CDV1_9FUNG|nr:uncharacterized protein SmJEL517_g01506 [Synchytrium microbalum]TPX36216.1 hypothetical protein SmJEL517_g01506 [Synchytrium microbalum]